MTKLCIGLDIDDVLLDFIGSFVNFHNFHYGTRLTKNSFCTFNFEDVGGGSIKEARAKVDFYLSSPFFKKIPPLPFSREAVSFLEKKYNLINITSRLDNSIDDTFEQISLYYGSAFKEIYFTNEWAQNGRKFKQDVCLEKGVDLFIDDSLNNVLVCAPNVSKCFLFGNYAWNKFNDEKLPKNVFRVADWKEVLEKINEY